MSIDRCPKCGSTGKLMIEPFMRGGTLANGERLDYYRCGACNALVSSLTVGEIMHRSVEFTGTGDIVLQGELGTDVVKAGVVMLTEQQAIEAQRHGWMREGEAERATQPPLYRVRKPAEASTSGAH